MTMENEAEPKPETIDSEEESKPNVIYVKDRPFLKLLKYAGIILLSGLALLYAVGFVTGLVGARVPYIDNGAIGNQLNNVLGNEGSGEDWNELERNP
jgi:hypothetical protein